MENNNAGYYKGLNGLRAASVFLVIAMHLNSHDFLTKCHLIKLWPILGGNAGVNLFFCISGFLITEILIRQKITDKLSVKNFIFRRVLRIFPLYYLFLIIILLLMVAHIIEVNKFTFVASAFYFSNFLPITFVSSVLGHTWSLAVEEHFYLLWPIIFIRFNEKTLLKIIISGIIICILTYFVIIYNDQTASFRFYLFTIPAILPILFGSLLAYIKNYYSNIFVKLFSGLNFLIPTFVFLILVLVPSINSIFYPLFNSIIYFFIIGYFIRYQNSLVVAFMENPLFSYIGKISYGIYIWQGLFIGSGSHLNIIVFDYNISKYPVNICLTILFSIVSFHFFESKFLVLKDKYFSNK